MPSWTDRLPRISFARPRAADLSPYELTLADLRMAARAQGKPPTGEIGATGSMVSEGKLIQVDYNADLRPPEMYDVFDRMRKSDGQVRAVMQAIKLPLLAATWSIAPASEDARDREIAEFIEAGLFAMTKPWDVVLRNILLHLDYGYMPLEKVWEVRDQMIHLRKLAPRHPRTVTAIRVDDHGGLEGITQRKPGDASPVDIDADRLLIFTNDEEAGDFRGTSVLRAAYKHWYNVDQVERITSVAIEKRALGVDVATMGGGASGQDATDTANVMESIRGHERGYIIEKEGAMKYRVEGISGGVIDPIPFLQHENLMIARSVHAEFVNMGADSSGSKAMHQDKTSFFLMGERAAGKQITDTVDRHLIPQWVAFNYEGVTKFPTLEHSALDTRQVAEFATAIATLLNAGALTPDRTIEEAARVGLALPELPDDPDIDELPADSVPTLPEGFDGIAARQRGRERRQFRGARPRRREPRPAERHVDFAKIEDTIDRSAADIVAAIEPIQTKQIDGMIAFARRIFDAGERDKIEDVQVQRRGDVATAIVDELNAIFDAGRKVAGEEFARQRGQPIAVTFAEPVDPEDLRDVRDFLGTRARSLSNRLADRLASTWTFEMLTQFRRGGNAAGEFDEPALRASLTKLSGQVTKRLAGDSVTEALNLGRDNVAQSMAEEIDHVVYSALLDSGTCSPCGDIDGDTFQLGSDEALAKAVPYVSCLGAGRCRCVHVYVLESEIS